MRYDDLKRIKTLIIVAALVMTAVILAACGRSSSEQATGSSSSASWAVPPYSDVAALGEGSDLIVIAKESDHSIEYRHELAFTHSYMKISKVYKGDAECGDVVDVLLTGDTHEEGYASRAGELPYILEDREYVLFLFKSPEDEEYGQYYLISGGYSGIAEISGDRFVSLSDSNKELVKGFKDYLNSL